MENYLWLFNNHNDDRGLWGAGLSSLLLHVIMFAIMATTTVFFPMTGENSKLDIVWLYPSFLLGGDAEPDAALPATPPREQRYGSSSCPANLANRLKLGRTNRQRMSPEPERAQASSGSSTVSARDRGLTREAVPTAPDTLRNRNPNRR